jgi:hypothetical protein
VPGKCCGPSVGIAHLPLADGPRIRGARGSGGPISTRRLGGAGSRPRSSSRSMSNPRDTVILDERRCECCAQIARPLHRNCRQPTNPWRRVHWPEAHGAGAGNRYRNAKGRGNRRGDDGRDGRCNPRHPTRCSRARRFNLARYSRAVFLGGAEAGRCYHPAGCRTRSGCQVPKKRCE